MIKSFNKKTPHLGNNVYISDTASVIGEVTLEDNVNIWFGSVLRGDMHYIRIGIRTNIQDNSVIHGDADVEICDSVVIGHRVMCHAAVVKNNVLLGNGCVVNDGVIIEEESIIGSGAMIIENMKIPKNSLVLGVPGRVKGEVKERHIELIKSTSMHYVEKGKLYKSQGLM